MEKIIENLEKLGTRIKIKTKLFYYKLKYGKRLDIGKKNKFRKRFKINIAKGGYLKIGNGNFWNDDCSINVRNKVFIGDKNLFGKNVNLYDHNHIFNSKEINKALNFNCEEIKIGNSNWFGTNVVILSKCSIQNNNVIGAGIVLNEDIASDIIVRLDTTKIMNIQKIRYKNNREENI